MPTYNRAALVVEAARSVIAQSVPDWELIVVDDGSTDNSVAALDALDDPRIRILRHPHLGNAARLRNIGAAAAEGQYLAFLDSDDLWLPLKLELQLRALAGTSDSWCYGKHELILADGARAALRAGQFRPISGRIARDLILDRTGASIITWLVPLGLFERAGGFDESLSMREDLDLLLRLAELGEAIAVPQVLALARDHSGRKTKGSADPHLASAIVFRNAASRSANPELKKLARRRSADHVASAGQQFLKNGNIAKGIESVVRALAGGASFQHCFRALGSGIRAFLKPAPG